jgi:hypothetical protein
VRAADRFDPDSLGREIALQPARDRLQNDLVADAFDGDHHRFSQLHAPEASHTKPWPLGLRLIGEAGFEVRPVPLVHDERPVGAEGFLAIRPGLIPLI